MRGAAAQLRDLLEPLGVYRWEGSFQWGELQSQTLGPALAALLRVGNGSFTPAAVNDTLAGCGVAAVAEETGDPLHLVVRFPDLTEEPADFDRLRGIVEDILPCHLLVEYRFGQGT